MPAAASHWYVGRDYRTGRSMRCTSVIQIVTKLTLNNVTTVLKNATASVPFVLPLGRQEGLSVL